MGAPRAKYRPSGRFNLVRLLVALPLNVGVAIALGTLMGMIGIKYTYAIVWVPAALTIPLAAWGYASAKLARMRNPYLGLLLGALLGASMYLGQYVTQYVYFYGPDALARPGQLVAFLTESVDHLIVFDIQDRVVRATTSTHHWVVFSVEMALCVIGSGFGWYVASAAPFCESCGRYLRSRVAILPLGAGAILAESLEGNELGEIEIPEEVKNNSAFSRVEVYGCQCGASTFISAMDHIPATTCQPLERTWITHNEYQRVIAKYPKLAV